MFIFSIGYWMIARQRPTLLRHGAAAAPRIGINFSRREGASAETARFSQLKRKRLSRPPTKDLAKETRDATAGTRDTEREGHVRGANELRGERLCALAVKKSAGRRLKFRRFVMCHRRDCPSTSEIPLPCRLLSGVSSEGAERAAV